MDGQKLHVVIVPCPFQGHLNPAVHLAAWLASKGLTVTFVVTEAIHQQVSNSSILHSAEFVLSDGRNHPGEHDVRCAIVSDGLPLEFDRAGNIEQYFQSLIRDMGSHVEDVVEKLVTEDPPISCLIADTFLVWSVAIARKFKLVHASWWTESAMVFSIYSHAHLLREKGHCSSEDPPPTEDPIDYIPGVEKIDVSDLPSYLQPPHLPTFVHQAVFESFESVKTTDIVLCNSVQELEQHAVPALNRLLNLPFLPIGPVNPLHQDLAGNKILCETDCTEWLNSKQPGSVIYVSFGSTFDVGPIEREEIAKGIIQSGCHFVWVHRTGSKSQFADDLLDKLSDRGIIIPWCRQAQVLSHKAVSAFLTHCGWNSVLESLWYEVPMLAFPIKTDQFSNRKLMVDCWKVAFDLGRRQKVSREEVAEKINELMHGEKGRGLRNQIRNLKREMEKAVSPDGSSTRNLQRFIEGVQCKMAKESCCSD